ncbi:hypothetical protein JOB18_037842 [Solea senegalensis]|uniref:Secreted protein n=1 Tax=Solea senegalensis TaxID=28829 RepID=A0AAV6PLP6_SOLSE|nr:hypothetical protein JOB18_037842 [Solea senegalensis]
MRFNAANLRLFSSPAAVFCFFSYLALIHCRKMLRTGPLKDLFLTLASVCSSQVITGHHRSSQVITGHRSSQLITGHHWSQLITGHHRSSQVITAYHRSSQVITGHHRSSQVITDGCFVVTVFSGKVREIVALKANCTYNMTVFLPRCYFTGRSLTARLSLHCPSLSPLQECHCSSVRSFSTLFSSVDVIVIVYIAPAVITMNVPHTTTHSVCAIYDECC